MALMFCSLSHANEDLQWHQLYQQDWYPSDPLRLKESRTYIERLFPRANLDSLQYLAPKDRQQLAQTTLWYLRGIVLKEYQTGYSHYAQMVIRIGELENDLLFQAEGYYFLAEELLVQRVEPKAIAQYLEKTKSLLTQITASESKIEMVVLLELRAQFLTARQQLLSGDFLGLISLMEQGLRQNSHQAAPEISARFLYLKGIGHYKLGQNELALQSLYESLSLEKQALQHHLLADINRYIGLTYLQQKKSDLAIDHLQRSIELYQQNDMPRHAAMSLRSIGKIYLKSNKPNEALAIFLNDLQQEKEGDHPQEVAWVSLLMAEAYLQLKESAQSQHYLTQARSMFEQAADDTTYRGQLQAQLMEAQVLALQATPQAIQQAVALAGSLQSKVRASNNRELIDFSNRIRIQLYQQAGQYQKANQLMIQELAELRASLSSSVGWRVKQVHEKFQFIEQQDQLASLRTALEKAIVNSNRYQKYAIWLTTFIFFAAAAALGWRHRFKAISAELSKSRIQAKQSPATGLANERLMFEQIQEEINKLQGQQEAWYTSRSVSDAPSGKLFMLVRIPMLQTIHEELGMEAGRRVERKIGQFLRSRFEETTVFQAKDDLIGFILPSHQLALAAKRLYDSLEKFSLPGVGPLQNLSIGMIQYPFVGRASKTTNLNVVGELLILAMTAATQLSKRHQSHAWVALEAIDAIPLTLFNSRVRDNLLLAIDKGFIKVLSNFDKSDIQWPQQVAENIKRKTKNQPILEDEIE